MTDVYSLIYPDNIKNRLLSYISSMTTMSRKGIDPNVITSNRSVPLVMLRFTVLPWSTVFLVTA